MFKVVNPTLHGGRRFSFLLQNTTQPITNLDAAIFMASMYNEVPNYSIEYVIYDFWNAGRNTFREFFAHRLGLIILDQDQEFDTDKVYSFDFKGPDNKTDPPREFTSKDLTEQCGLRTVYDDQLISLLPGERIKGRLIVRLGIGHDHGKWCPVSNITFKEVEGGFLFGGYLTGVYSLEKVLELSIAGFDRAKSRPAPTIFQKR